MTFQAQLLRLQKKFVEELAFELCQRQHETDKNDKEMYTKKNEPKKCQYNNRMSDIKRKAINYLYYIHQNQIDIKQLVSTILYDVYFLLI